MVLMTGGAVHRFAHGAACFIGKPRLSRAFAVGGGGNQSRLSGVSLPGYELRLQEQFDEHRGDLEDLRKALGYEAK